MAPTVLFVLGAVQESIGNAPTDEAAGRDKLRQLVLELRHAQPVHGVRIQWCRDIGAYAATKCHLLTGWIGRLTVPSPGP